MQQIFSNTTLTVNQLIEKNDTGELGLPELQRQFIWKDAKVRDLFDSMMRVYQIHECEECKKYKVKEEKYYKMLTSDGSWSEYFLLPIDYPEYDGQSETATYHEV